MTLDLAGVREFVRRLDATADVRWAERAARVEARLVEAGAGRHLRMAAWLWDVPLRLGQTPRDLLAAGVPMRVVQLVIAMPPRRNLWRYDEYVRAVLGAGAEPLMRAELAEVIAAPRTTGLPTRRDALALLAALDLATSKHSIAASTLIADLDRGIATDAWWYAVAALGGRRHSEAMPALLAAYRRLKNRASTAQSAARYTLTDAMAEVMTGSATVRRYAAAGPPPERSWEPLLRELAEDPDDNLRELAVLLLGRLRDPKHIPLFIGQLGTALELPDAAAAAARVLGQLGAVEAVEPLINVLSDGHLRYYWPKEEAARALGRLGAATDNVTGALTSALIHPQPAVARAAAHAFLTLGGDRTAACLLRHATDASAWALGELGMTEAVPALIEWLEDSNARESVAMAAACAEALGKLGAAEAAGTLAAVATGPIYSTARRNAVWALGRTDPDAGIEALLFAAADPDDDVRLQAARALANCRDRRAVFGMVALLRDGVGERIVLRALATRPDPRTVPVLLQAFRNTTDRHTRRLAADALCAVAPDAPSVARQVAQHLGRWGTETPYLRRAAVSVLGRIGEIRYAIEVAECLKDDDKLLRARAAAALGRLGPPDGLPDSDAGRIEGLLRAAVDDPTPKVRANATTALGSWKRRRDKALLRKALRDDHPDVRAAATAALRRHGVR